MYWDVVIFNFINGFAGRWSWLDSLAIFCAVHLGWVVSACLLLFLVRNYQKYWRMLAEAFVAALLVRFVLVEIFYWLHFRFRPFVRNPIHLLIPYDPTLTSFPSGHASFYFALSTIIFSYHKKAGILCYVASTLIVISRIFVGVHWPSDVIAGITVGVVMGLVLNRVFRKLERRTEETLT